MENAELERLKAKKLIKVLQELEYERAKMRGEIPEKKKGSIGKLFFWYIVFGLSFALLCMSIRELINR